MSESEVDLFVVGAGSGGVRAARIAAGYGAKVAVAEEYRIGGTCVIRGCVPKKLMVLASRFADAFDDAAGFGWTLPKAPEFSWPALREAKDREIARLSEIYENNLARSNVEIHRSRAVLDDAHNVRLTADGRVIRAKNILIATGGHPTAPRIPGADLALSSDAVFDLKELPRRMLIVGGGYIALEFACMFQRLGVHVTLLHRGEKVLRGFDEDIRDEIMLSMAAEGVTLKMNDTVASVAEEGDGRRVTYVSGDDDVFDIVFFATGRTPNTSELGLEKAGVKLRPDGAIEVDDASRTSVPHIFAVGDVTNRINLTPVAIREGHALADTLFGGQERVLDHSLVATAVFSTPEIAAVGINEQEARERMLPFDIYTAKFRSLKHVLTRRQERTFMKLVVDATTDKVLGVHVMGEDAGEIIQLAAVALGMGATKADFDRTVAVHPTAAEELVTLREKVHVPNPGGA
ncbi:glutathione-disulfide reductase [Terrihabitans sp. B22-R8]|uniref:glutathione-disulfide reductase n=1 Tax=Terrihabitans sp. B22-R8 TaxID=3425128 RepID=UPI00403D2976